MAEHEAVQLQLHFPLGHARTHERQHVGKGGVGNVLGLLHAGQFGLVLHGTQVEHELAGLGHVGSPAQVDLVLGGRQVVVQAEGLAQLGVVGQGHGVLYCQVAALPPVRVQIGSAVLLPDLGAHPAMGCPGVVHLDGRSRSRGAAGAGIAAVGMKHGTLSRNHQGMGLLFVKHVVEAGQPLDVGGTANKERVHPLVEARTAQALQSRHTGRLIRRGFLLRGRNGIGLIHQNVPPTMTWPWAFFSNPSPNRVDQPSRSPSSASQYPAVPCPLIWATQAGATTLTARKGSRASTSEMWISTTGVLMLPMASRMA